MIGRKIKLPVPGKHLDILMGGLILLGITITRLYGYLLFHSLAELFSIIIAFGTFMVAWNSRRFHVERFFLFIGIAYAFIGGLDTLHMLAYKGMGVFHTRGPYLALQLWLAARYVESLSLFIAPLFCARKMNIRLVFLGYSAVISFLLGTIFFWNIFPRCFIEGVGLTPFKKTSEYIISLVLAAAVYMLLRKRSQFNPGVLRLLMASIFLTIASELTFTLYKDVYAFFNMGGHLLKIISFYLIYKAIIETTLARPYDLLFRELKQKEESLEKAKEAAEFANRAKSQFLANMSHELRTPLTAILGYAQILKGSPSSSPYQRERLEIIKQSGTHLLTLIDDVLDLAKIEAGKLELHPGTFHLLAFLKGICEILQIRAEHKGISFINQPYNFIQDRPDSDCLPAFVRGDEKRLRQVLINLLGNAVKFTDRGGVTLKVGPVELAGEEKENGVPLQNGIRFRIEDTGIGIEAEQLAAVFEPFHQVGSTAQASRGEGTGLGLTISRNFIRLMGGELKVESRIGKGTTFWFDIALPAVVNKALDHVPAKRRITGIKIKDKVPTLLVVEHRKEIRAVFKNLLEPLGFKIIEADDGDEGLAKAVECQPTAIIFDPVMPGMDGFKMIRRIRRSPLLKKTVIISTTADVFEDGRQGNFISGSDAFLSQPVQAEVLYEILQRHLDLEWEYEDKNENTEEIPVTPPVILPPAPVVTAALYELSMRGDINELKARVTELEQSDLRLKPFLTEVRQLVNGYQLKKLSRLLESYLK